MGDTAEDQAVFNTSNRQPFIYGSLYPVWHWDRADVTTLTEEVNDGPVIVSLLQVRQLQTDQLGTPQATAQQEGQDGMISLGVAIPHRHPSGLSTMSWITSEPCKPTSGPRQPWLRMNSA